jgi:polyhydroxyalkanoate synthesis regulator phasin
MASNDVLARLIESGMSFTQMTQARAEEIVRDLTKSGDIRKKEAQRVTQQLVDRGRESTEKLLAMVQAEVAKQVGRFATQLDEVESRLEDLAEQVRSHLPGTSAPAAAPATASAGPAPTSPGAPAKKAAAKKAPAKKAAAKKAPAKKAPAKKAAAKKAPAKKAVAKKATTRKSTASKTASAKKASTRSTSSARKAPAKKASTSSLPSKKVTMGTRPAAKKSAR